MLFLSWAQSILMAFLLKHLCTVRLYATPSGGHLESIFGSRTCQNPAASRHTFGLTKAARPPFVKINDFDFLFTPTHLDGKISNSTVL